MAALEAFKDKMAAGLASLEEFKGRWLDEMAGLKRAMENISAAMEMVRNEDERREATNLGNEACIPVNTEAAENVEPMELSTPPVNVNEEMEAVLAEIAMEDEREKKVKVAVALKTMTTMYHFGK